MPKRPAIWISSVVTIAVCSCVPKAIVVEQNAPTVAALEPKKEETPEVQPEPTLSGPPNDGIRLPDMLTLPGENEFRKPVTSSSPGSGSGGAVIARPPSE